MKLNWQTFAAMLRLFLPFIALPIPFILIQRSLIDSVMGWTLLVAAGYCYLYDNPPWKTR